MLRSFRPIAVIPARVSFSILWIKTQRQTSGAGLTESKQMANQFAGNGDSVMNVRKHQMRGQIVDCNDASAAICATVGSRVQRYAAFCIFTLSYASLAQVDQ